jgi:LysM repeat protein
VRWDWFAYLTAMALAELALAFLDPRLGIGLHLLLVFVLTAHAAFGADADRPLRVALLLVPFVRVASLAVPAAADRPIPWFAMTALPMLAGALAAWRMLRFTRSNLGLRTQGLPLQLGIGLLGIPMGVAESVAFGHLPATTPGTAASVALAVAVLLVSGFVLELTFRGVLQTAATICLGSAGLVYAGAAFAILHIPALTVASVLLGFAEGLALGWMVSATGSMIGVGLARGIANVVAVLVIPVLLTRWQIGPMSVLPAVLPAAPTAALQSTPATPSVAPSEVVPPEAGAAIGAVPATAPAQATPSTPELPTPVLRPAAVVAGAVPAAPAGLATPEPAPTPTPTPQPGAASRQATVVPTVPRPAATSASTDETALEPEPQPSPPPTPAGADQFETYTVQPGDSLYDLARAHGSTVAELARLNSIPNPAFILIGQQLRLPKAQTTP